MVTGAIKTGKSDRECRSSKPVAEEDGPEKWMTEETQGGEALGSPGGGYLCAVFEDSREAGVAGAREQGQR